MDKRFKWLKINNFYSFYKKDLVKYFLQSCRIDMETFLSFAFLLSGFFYSGIFFVLLEGRNYV